MKLLAVVALTLALSAAAFLPAHACHHARSRACHAKNPPSRTSAAAYGQYDEVWRVHTQRKDIALTFDDGPYPFYTPLLLHVLGRSQVHATFFLVGRSAQEFPELVSRIVASGDELGNHTFNHVAAHEVSRTRRFNIKFWPTERSCSSSRASQSRSFDRPTGASIFT